MHSYVSLIIHALKWKGYFDELFITGCTRSCQNDNFKYTQWWKPHQNDDFSISLWVAMFLWPCMCSSPCFNSMAPGRPRCHFKTAIFNDVLLIGIFTSSKDNALRWMPRDLTDDKSTLVRVMAWCCQATSHYLSQCWPSSMSLYGVTRPQWVNLPDSKDPWINVD